MGAEELEFINRTYPANYLRTTTEPGRLRVDMRQNISSCIIILLPLLPHPDQSRLQMDGRQTICKRQYMRRTNEINNQTNKSAS